jgi:hypothetical protein
MRGTSDTSSTSRHRYVQAEVDISSAAMIPDIKNVYTDALRLDK